jgi:small subunit ribosomal protein S7e
MEKIQQLIKQAPESNLIKEISNIVSHIIPDKRTDKTKQRSALVTDVKELNLTTPDKKKIGVLIVYLPFALAKKNSKELPKIVNEIQSKKNKHTFIVCQRTMINKKADFKQQIPRNRTLTAVYDSILEDLISPGYIVGKRSCIRLDGSTYSKIYINEEAKVFLTERSEIIEKIYFSLTNRKISIEFKKEANFAVLPKIRVRKEKDGKKPARKTNVKAN